MPKAYIKDDFNNLLEYQSWLANAFQHLSSNNQSFAEHFTETYITNTINREPDWFGEGVTFQELSIGVTEYKHPALIQRVYNKVSHVLSTDIVEKIKTRRLRFNALGLGMFSFERAAMTMYRLQEWYSPTHSCTVTEKDVIRQGNQFALRQDDSMVIQRWEERSDGRPRVRTHTKELSAYFPEPPREKHAVELYISCDAPASKKADEMLYSGIAAVILAELLLKAGIRVKINVVIGSALTQAREAYVGCIIPVKQFDEMLDSNVLALLSSDPRFMRFDAFKGVVAAFDHFNMLVPQGMGFSMNALQLKDMLEKSGYTRVSQAQHRYYFGGTFSEAAAIHDVRATINDLAQKLQQK